MNLLVKNEFANNDPISRSQAKSNVKKMITHVLASIKA